VTWLARAVFVVLIGATFAAFFAAQRIKGEPAVAKVRSLDRVFSPNRDGTRDVNEFQVALREAGRISVDVVDDGGNAVRRLADDASVTPSTPLPLRWDGRTEAGTRVRDGRYRMRVTLRREGRSVIPPRATVVDTRPPRPRVRSIVPGPIVGPRPGSLRIEVRDVPVGRPKSARVVRMDGGEPRVVAELPSVSDTRTLTWDGRVDGRPAPPGTYLVQVTARDRAGNLGRAPAEVPPLPGQSRGHPGITVRTIAAEAPMRPVTAGRRVRINVDARKRPYRWLLRRVGTRKPVARGREAAGQPVELRAPGGNSGLYVLELQAGHHTTAVPVPVQSRRRAAMLVVVPVMSWVGTDEVDQDGDGVPNTLLTGRPVNWPRVLAGGLPDALVHDAAPLLAHLDRAKVRYDLTTDLDLALSTGPRASDRRGVLLAGPERWITRAYARRLRRYVLEGGRVASIGTESLRRGVTILHNDAGTAGELVRPTQPAMQDPFGTRLEPLRRADAPVTLSLIGGDADAGLLEGFDGALEGFSVLEESRPPASGRGRLQAALGVETAPPEETEEVPEELPPPALPALASTELGDGVMIRLGLPEWTQRLDDRQVSQITLNIADILRGVRPRIRSVPNR
jgi:flagellar hook assembly protein FlgD